MGAGGAGGGVAARGTAGVEVMLMRILGAVGAACTVGCSWTFPSMELTTAACVVSTRVVTVSSTEVMIGSSSEQTNTFACYFQYSNSGT